MATLQEYYVQDFSRLNACQENWLTKFPNQQNINVTTKVHLDFDAHVFFVSFFIPMVEDEIQVFNYLLNNLEDALNIQHRSLVSCKQQGEEEFVSSKELLFSGKIFFYYDGYVNKLLFDQLKKKAISNDLFIHCRDINMAVERSKVETPLAFISHDSRDKDLIASVIANELQKRMIPIWYDEYSLRLGDSLRESIEKGLKECKKCILILSPNFIENLGWTKVEFNTIFTREIIETKNLVLPVWAGVTKEEIYDYCPLLVDRVGVNWDKGLEVVVNKIQRALLAES